MKMPHHFADFRRLQKLTPLRLWLLSVFSSIVVTEIIVSCMERLLKGDVSYDYLATGLVAALFVAGIVAAILISFLNRLKLEAQCRDKLVKELAKSEERNNLTAKANHQCLWDYDVTTGEVYLSEGWSQLLGGAEEPTRTTIHDLIMLVPESDQPKVRDAILSALKGHNASTYQITHRARKFNGDFIWVLSEGRVVERDQDGRGLRMIGTNRDVTERKGIEDFMANIRLEMENQHALQVAVQTAAAIAHELNQPLAAVTGYCAAARHMLDELPHAAQEQLDCTLNKAMQQAARAGKVVHELLELLQRDKSRSEIINLNDTIHEALDAVNTGALNRFNARLELLPDLKPVQANQLHVRKVVANLVRNGVEAMSNAGLQAAQQFITIRTTVDGGMARVTIQDSGPGLSNESASHVFEPFFTTKKNGVGMGLITSRALVESSGGRLWFDPTRGDGGAMFHFTLPLVI